MNISKAWMKTPISVQILTHTVMASLHIQFEIEREREGEELKRHKKERSEEWGKAEKKEVKEKKEGERRDMGTKRREERMTALSVFTAESISGPERKQVCGKPSECYKVMGNN